MGIGSLHDVRLAEARDRARAYRRIVQDGRDPIEEGRERKREQLLERAESMTFRECAEVYIAAQKAGWKNPKHAAQWPSTLARYVYPVFGELPVQAIDTGLVMKALAAIWTEKPETASRVRGRIESVLDWAGERMAQG